jgi:SAM-dependent methyltransferase
MNRKLLFLVVALFSVACIIIFLKDCGDPMRRFRESLSTSEGSVPEAAYPWVAELRSKKISPHAGQDDTVLEYGVRFGWNIAHVECKRKIGFDPSESFEQTVRDHGMEFVHDLGSVEDASIDVVVCHHVLEHSLSPGADLAGIRRMIRPRGKLLLFVPYEKGRRTRRYDPDDRHRRLYSWNVQTLGNLVEMNGFSVLEARVGRFGYDRFCAVLADRCHLGEFGFRVVRGTLHVLRPGFEVELVAMKK